MSPPLPSLVSLVSFVSFVSPPVGSGVPPVGSGGFELSNGVRVTIGVQSSASGAAWLEAAGAQISMATKGNVYENALAESFFATLQTELTNTVKYTRHQAAVASIIDYVDTFYDDARPHSHLGYVGPMEFELRTQVKAFAASSGCPQKRGKSMPWFTPTHGRSGNGGIGSSSGSCDTWHIIPTETTLSHFFRASNSRSSAIRTSTDKPNVTVCAFY